MARKSEEFVASGGEVYLADPVTAAAPGRS
jgi:hypothetical protein